MLLGRWSGPTITHLHEDAVVPPGDNVVLSPNHYI